MSEIQCVNRLFFSDQWLDFCCIAEIKIIFLQFSRSLHILFLGNCRFLDRKRNKFKKMARMYLKLLKASFHGSFIFRDSKVLRSERHCIFYFSVFIVFPIPLPRKPWVYSPEYFLKSWKLFWSGFSSFETKEQIFYANLKFRTFKNYVKNILPFILWKNLKKRFH